MQIKFLYHILRNIWQSHLWVFGPFQWSHEVKIGEICVGKLGSLHQYDSVQEVFDEKQVGCWGTYIFRIVDEVASHCGLDSIWILLLSADVADKFDISHIF